MGRLDDIVQRNREAMNGGRRGSAEPRRVLMDALNDHGEKPAAEVPPFTLPSQRRTGTPIWKVLIFMVVAGLLGAAMLARSADRDAADAAGDRP